MFWPLALPFQITIWLWVVLVALLTALAPNVKWTRRRMFGTSLAFACLAFIPTCTVINTVIDFQRFGTFHYNSASEVNDFRVERYLPANATNITLKKYPQGYCARYSISKADLLAYLDGVWDKYGQHSAIPRQRLRNGEPVSEKIDHPMLADLGWPPLQNPIAFDSPFAANGAGATYYLDATTDTVYEMAGYW